MLLPPPMAGRWEPPALLFPPVAGKWEPVAGCSPAGPQLRHPEMDGEALLVVHLVASRPRTPEVDIGLYCPPRPVPGPTLGAGEPEAVHSLAGAGVARSLRWLPSTRAEVVALQQAPATSPAGATCGMPGGAGFPLSFLSGAGTPSILGTWKRPMGLPIQVGASWVASPEAA